MNQLTEIFKYVPLESPQLQAICPLVLLSFLAILTLILSTGKGDSGYRWAALSSIMGLGLIMLFSLSAIVGPSVSLLGDVLVFTPLTRSLSFIIMGIGLCSLLLLSGHAKREQLLPEAYALILFATTGMMLVALTNHLIFTFIAIEIMSLAVYVLVGLKRDATYSAEAAMKYFILGGVAGAMFLYGSALIFGATGTFSLSSISTLLSTQGYVAPPLLSIGGLLILAGLLFKVGCFPFHFWVPDVYQGASHSITGFMSSAVKLAAFIPLIKISQQVYFALPASSYQVFYISIWVLSAVTMLFANLSAIGQYEIKRLLAYSSIAHTGYILAGVLVAGTNPNGELPVYIYLAFYVLSNLGAMAIVTMLAKDHQKDLTFDDLSGVANRHPFLAFGLSIFLLAMAGIPMTAGFIGKYLLLNNVVMQGETLLVVIAVISSLISVYYYLRVIVFMYMKEEQKRHQPTLSFGPVLVTGIMLIMTVQFGFFPRQVISYFYRIIR